MEELLTPQIKSDLINLAASLDEKKADEYNNEIFNALCALNHIVAMPFVPKSIKILVRAIRLVTNKLCIY